MNCMCVVFISGRIVITGLTVTCVSFRTLMLAFKPPNMMRFVVKFVLNRICLKLTLLCSLFEVLTFALPTAQ